MAQRQTPTGPTQRQQRVAELIRHAIAEVLQRGDIRLLRTAWLLAQPNSKPLPNRQELEALEEQLTGDEVSPLLQPDEAVALIHCADRRVTCRVRLGRREDREPVRDNGGGPSEPQHEIGADGGVVPATLGRKEMAA